MSATRTDAWGLKHLALVRGLDAREVAILRTAAWRSGDDEEKSGAEAHCGQFLLGYVLAVVGTWDRPRVSDHEIGDLAVAVEAGRRACDIGRFLRTVAELEESKARHRKASCRELVASTSSGAEQVRQVLVEHDPSWAIEAIARIQYSLEKSNAGSRESSSLVGPIVEQALEGLWRLYAIDSEYCGVRLLTERGMHLLSAMDAVARVMASPALRPSLSGHIAGRLERLENDFLTERVGGSTPTLDSRLAAHYLEVVLSRDEPPSDARAMRLSQLIASRVQSGDRWKRDLGFVTHSLHALNLLFDKTTWCNDAPSRDARIGRGSAMPVIAFSNRDIRPSRK
jgi:hypothetical protein